MSLLSMQKVLVVWHYSSQNALKMMKLMSYENNDAYSLSQSLHLIVFLSRDQERLRVIPSSTI